MRSTRILQLLDIYKSVAVSGRFCRMIACDYSQLDPHICEGRWYSEVKRCGKYGVAFDWKTTLNAIIRRYMPIPHCSQPLTRLVQECEEIVNWYTG